MRGHRLVVQHVVERPLQLYVLVHVSARRTPPPVSARRTPPVSARRTPPVTRACVHARTCMRVRHNETATRACVHAVPLCRRATPANARVRDCETTRARAALEDSQSTSVSFRGPARRRATNVCVCVCVCARARPPPPHYSTGWAPWRCEPSPRDSRHCYAKSTVRIFSWFSCPYLFIVRRLGGGASRARAAARAQGPAGRVRWAPCLRPGALVHRAPISTAPISIGAGSDL